MQKRVLFIAFLLLAICNKIVADDQLTASNVSMYPGDSKEVSVVLTNDETYVGFQFDLYLPDGLTVESFSGNSNRLPEGTTPQMAQQSDGSYRFVVAALGGNPIAGNDGPVLTLTVKAGDSIAANAYTGYLRNIKISKADGSGVVIAEQPFTVTIAERPKVANVVFAQNGYIISLSTTTEGATIRYNLSNGGTGEQTYNSPLTMTGDCTITAYAMKDGFNASDTTAYTFVAADVTVATPTFSQTGNVVTISTATSGASIYYTTDGTTPTTASNAYPAGGITVTSNVTIKAIAVRENWFNSAVGEYHVNSFKVADVQFAQSGNMVTLSTTTANAKIFYTLSNNGGGEQEYNAPLTMTGDCTIEAWATRDGYLPSDTTSFVFHAGGVTCSNPVLARTEGTNVVTATTTTEGATIYYTADGSDPTEGSAVFPTEGLTVNRNQTIKAIALRDTYYPSQVTTFEVDWFKVANVAFAQNGYRVTLSTTTEGATIRYNLSNGGTGEQTYNSPLTMTGDCTITAYAMKDGFNASDTTAYTFVAADVTVATPTFSQEGNVVTISTTTSGASIYYTTDGTTPTTASNAYPAGGITVTSNVTIKAIAVRENWFNSAVAEYHVNSFKVADVQFAQSGNMVTLSTTTANAKIFYTLSNDGNGEQEYAAPLTMTGDCTIEAWATRDGYLPSDTTSFVFHAGGVTCSNPVFARDGNVINISTQTDGASIYYTIDGTDPTEQSILYTEAITVDHNMTIKAIAMRQNYYPSQIETFVVDWFQCEKPTFSWNGDELTIATTTTTGDGRSADILYTLTEYNGEGGKVYATFENPSNTNTTWNDSTRTFTWSATYYNQLHNIGLPSGDITKYKKLVVDCEIKSGEQIRVLIYKGDANLTLYASNGVNQFILADTLKALYPDTYSEFLLECTEICLSGNNSVAPGEAVINSVYLDTSVTQLYKGPITVTNDVTISAIARLDGYNDSEEARLVYPYTAWQELLSAVSEANVAIQQATGNDNVPQQMVNELMNMTDSAQMMYAHRTAEEAAIKDETVQIHDLTNAVLQLTNAQNEPYAVLTGDTISGMTLTFYYDKKKQERSGMGVGPFADETQRGWHSVTKNITQVIIDASMANDTTLTSTAYWFEDFFAITSIEGLENLNTTNVTNMNSMFNGCIKITSLSIPFSTVNVTDMGEMFFAMDALVTLDVSGMVTDNVTDMNAMFSGDKNLRNLGITNFNTSKVGNMSWMFGYCESLESINLSHFSTASATNLYGMFDGCSSLTSLDLSTFDTQNVVRMSLMFRGCSSLTALDLSSFDVQKVTDVNSMFNGCSQLQNIFVNNSWNMVSLSESEWARSDVFTGCASLVGGMGTVYDANHVDAEYARIDGGTAAPGYFTDKNAPKEELEIYSIQKSVTYVANQPINPTQSIIMTPGNDSEWRTDLAIGLTDTTTGESNDPLMFNASIYYPNLTETFSFLDALRGTLNPKDGDLTTNADTGEVTNTGSAYIPGQKNLPKSGAYIIYEALQNGSLIIPIRVTADKSLFVVTANGSPVVDMQFKDAAGTTQVLKADPLCSVSSDYISGFISFNVEAGQKYYVFCNGSKPRIAGYIFSPEAIAIDPATMADVKSILEAEPYAVLTDDSISGKTLTFYYDDKKTERNGMSVGPFTQDGGYQDWASNSNTITTAVFDASFANCTTLTSTAYWFYQCQKLTTIEGIGNLKTDHVTDMENMFWNCPALTVLDVTGFNTANVTNMSGMFGFCSALTSLDVSGFNTANVTDMSYMFYQCKNVPKLNVSSFKTEQVTNMSYMFYECSGLTALDVSGFTTTNVTNMSDMFYNCSSLTSIDLLGFNTQIVTHMGGMFYGCSNLTTIYVGDGWSTDKVENGGNMFIYCTSLVGGKGTTYDENHTDYTYAHIDGGPSNPGYFTRSGDSPYIAPEYTFDGTTGVLAINGGTTLAEALDAAGGRDEVARTITAIVWNSTATLTNSDLQGLDNPNMLVYVQSASQAPANRDNVVIGNDSTGYMAKNIKLTDVTEGNGDFYCPIAFTAEMISYAHEYRQQTEVGVSRGWETIAMPFTVQTIMHETKGLITPFGTDSINKHFWLRQLTQQGLAQARRIEANTPYLISMPNSDAYSAEFNLNGRVTFSSQNAEVPVTQLNGMEVQTATGDMVLLQPNFKGQSATAMIYALNVGEQRDGHPEGSVFVANDRSVRPFEAFTVHHGNGPAPQFISVSAMNGDVTGIEDVRGLMSDGRGDNWYDLNGRRLQQKPTKKGIYIQNGKKTIIK